MLALHILQIKYYTAGVGAVINQIVAAETYVKSEHFQERQAQRSISDADVMLALNRGRRFFEGDDRVYFLARRYLPREMPDNCARRAEGTVVVVGADGVLVTTYRTHVSCASLNGGSIRAIETT